MLWKDQIREWKDEAREDGLKEGLAEGEAKGKAIGLKEGVIETAKKMIKNKISMDLIATCTGLSLEEVNKLKK